jgi:hypothetical protein
MRCLSFNSILVWLVALLGITPFVLLSFFAQPSADDWYMAADTLEKGYWQANIDFYKTVTGRFFSSAMLFVHPMLLSFGAFKCYSFALVLGLVASIRWAIGGWFPEASRGWKWMMATLASVMFVWGMASPAEGFYWGTGSACYTVPGIMTCCLAGMFGKRCLQLEWRPRPALMAVALLLTLAITGCTEVAMALFFAHITILNALFFWRHRKVSQPLLMVLVVTLIGVVIVALAPGNSQRRTWYNNDVNHMIVPATLMALKFGVRQMAVWMVFVPFFLFSLVTLSAWPAQLNLSTQRAWELIVVSLVLMAGTVFGGFFLGTWCMGAAIPFRAVNVMLLFFIMDWVVFLAGGIALLRSFNLEVPRPGVVLAVFAFLIFCSNVVMSTNNVKVAWRDLLSGDAVRYDRESAQRHAMILASDEADVTVPPLQSRPKTLFFNDFKPDSTNWRNTGGARFFRKHSIALKP